jgi:hypothetical protein
MYIESPRRYQITTIGKNGLFESATVFEVPEFLHCLAHQWLHYSVTPIDASPEIFGIGKTARDIAKSASIKTVQVKHREHESLQIFLCPQTTVTCQETGISYRVELPSQAGTNLVMSHPLAIAENAMRLIKQTARLGKPLTSVYEKQILAGMLLTLLRSNGLLRCKDAVKANLYLQNASAETLASVCNSIAGLSSVIGLPSLSLLDVEVNFSIMLWEQTIPENAKRASAEVLLHNYLRDLQHARDGKKEKREERQRKTKSIKIVSNPVIAQSKKNKELKPEINGSLRLLQEKYKTKDATFCVYLASKVKSLAFLSTARREALAAEVISKWPLDVDAGNLASVIKDYASDKIENDLLGLDGALSDWRKGRKATFADSLIKKS